jgi:ABC-type branched-subunit amino acid transport system substrate-binding protein
VLVALVGCASACGARLDDAQRATALGAVVGEAGTAEPAPVAGEVTSTTAAPLAPGEQPVAAPDPVAGPVGQAAAGPAPAGACRPVGGGDVGVTPTEIAIGNVVTISGPVPGLGQTAQNGVKAYVNYVNSKGGVCGRKLKLLPADDRLDTGTNRAEHERLSKQVFAFAGAWSVVDDGGAAVLAGSGIPDVGLALNDQRTALPNSFSPTPFDPNVDSNGTVEMFQWFKANMGVSKGAIVYPAQSAARKRGLFYGNDMRAAGIDVVVETEVAITQTDYTGVATQIKNAGADVVITTLEMNGMSKLAQAFDQQGYRPKVPYYGGQAYGVRFLELAGRAAEGTVIGMGNGFIEEPSMATFRQWYTRTNPGNDPDTFAIVAWAATELLVQAIERAGPTPTRAAVLDQLGQVHDFDASGVLAPHNDPAGRKSSPCFVIAAVEGGKWVRKHPASGFQC